MEIIAYIVVDSDNAAGIVGLYSDQDISSSFIKQNTRLQTSLASSSRSPARTRRARRLCEMKVSSSQKLRKNSCISAKAPCLIEPEALALGCSQRLPPMVPIDLVMENMEY